MPETLQDWLTALEQRHARSIDLGLERCGEVYRNMGAPRPGRRVFSVAGTNGKGSVVAYLAGVIGAAGLDCGTYTSPHILQFNERIRIGGTPVPERDLVRAFELVEAARRDVSLTYFEFTTLAAFQLMSEAGLDAAVLEVGLGGRLDAVNLVDADCAVITVVGLDHQDYLGTDRESIGFEKAGIMRAGRPVVCGDRAVPESVSRHARNLGAELIRIGREFDVREAASGLELNLGNRRYPLARPPLQGGHQSDNLATALVALDRVFGDLLEQEEIIRRGVAGTRLAGRLERCGADPRIILDVGHNPLAARAVREYLQAMPRSRTHCILGMLADKDAEGVAMEFDPVIDTWWCAGLSGTRGQGAERLAARLAGAGVRTEIHVLPDVADALTRARAAAGPADTLLVFGSFETVAAATRHLGSEPVQEGPMLIES